MSTTSPLTQQARPRTVLVDGARVACWESGPRDGEPVLLLHGYPSDHHSWDHQIPVLSLTHRVIAPDLLGWGASEQPLHLAYDYDTEVERLGRLLDALGLDAVTLVGHDYGGFLSLGFTQTHPGRVRRLAILNSRSHATFVPHWRALFDLFTLAGRTPVLRSLTQRLPFPLLHRWAFGPLVETGAVDSDVMAAHLDHVRPLATRRWLVRFYGHYRTAPRAELRQRLGQVTCPTAVIWGRRDKYLSPAIAMDLAARVPGAELTMVDDAGHWVMDERPAEVNTALERLLGRDA
ncbi:alpha/beta fold hydrolase [Streptomyces sp. B93]|uniref:alpha/beta fold hydrolase n=1 Tax=Streptomyces sp. B93 TaxID=2824875 RepID=UPI001B371094|nr:alpha/beta hydrolase [Streptomyces sp. B93]MBQ1092485.1 alpha/beta hydrolase [Streptomyces sp. B93]